MEGSSAVEHNRRGHYEERPFGSRHAPSPHRRHQVYSRGVLARSQCHVDDADDKGRDCDNERKREPVEKVLSFAKLHAASTFLERRRMIDGHIEWRRVHRGDGRDDRSDREYRRFRSVRDLNGGVHIGGYRFYDCDLNLEAF